ncbi:cache domain-containing sensor histidine kinase [Cohnella sp. 56]|uniref:cache domain-containing sensor histidine kinase n=1 Tax=Cohnella sp. 56 TaxID=3113722 RepID=UPI0030EA59D6
MKWTRIAAGDLFRKMILLMCLSVLVPLGALGYLSYEQSKKQIGFVTTQFLEDNLRVNAKGVDDFLQGVERQSESIIGSGELQSFLRQPEPSVYTEELTFINRMNALTARLKGPYELYIRPKSLKAYPNYRNLMGLSRIDPESAYFEEALTRNGQGKWVHLWDERIRQPVHLYVRAIRSLDDFEPIGIMAIRVPEYLVRTELIPPSSFKNYRFVMVDDRNRIISQPYEGAYLEPYRPIEGWSSAEIALQDGGKLIAMLPERDLTGNIGRIKSFTIATVIASFLVIALFVAIVIRNFTLPIMQLVKHMKQVRKGLLEPFRLPRARDDEIGQLVNGYNRMTRDMSDLLDATKRMESDKRQLEMQSLIHQINPHFFYNTLDSIKWSAERANVPDIAEMVTKLANLLRFSLNNGEERTTVGREIEHARSYMEIELLRSKRSFQFFVQADPDVLGLGLIKLILQPLVENAVKHGMNRMPEGKGKIRLTVRRSGASLIFVVEDNGPGAGERQDIEEDAGMPRERRSAEFGHGIGLSNVHKRIQLHFGEPYGIEIEQGRTEGFRISIRVPVQESR